jgi:hypothetical protein
MSEAVDAPAAPAAEGTQEAAPQQSTPSFTIDAEAFKAAAPEGYDVSGAMSILEKHKGDAFGILKSATELEKSFSSRMKVPDPADPESMAAAWNKLGRPEAADGYKFEEGVAFRDEAAKAHISSKMHEFGVSNEQANKLLQLQIEMNSQEDQQFQQSITDGKALTDKQIQEWSGGMKGSSAFNTWENAADSALKHFGVDKSNPESEAFFASDQGRAILKMAHTYAQAAKPGQIPGMIAQSESSGSLESRKKELYHKMVSNGSQFSPQDQAELDSITQQLKQYRS